VSQIIDLATAVSALRCDFPLLGQAGPDGRPHVYLDSGATSQKPACVIEKEAEVYRLYNANVHRGVHALGDRVTGEFEQARQAVRELLNAPEAEEVVFTSGTTASLNIIALGWGGAVLQPGDEILLNEAEHHANLVPWQQVAAQTRARLTFIPLTPDGRLDLDRLDEVLTSRTRVVSLAGMSNVLGTIHPVAELARRARAVGARVVLDGAQSIPHQPTDVQALGVDFAVFSGHKLYGPTGVGVLWGRRELLEEANPLLTGGNMIRRVWKDHSDFGELPAKFEAGTPPIAQAIALGTAVTYLQQVGWPTIHALESDLTGYLLEQLSLVEGLRILGPSREHRGSIVSFVQEGLQATDVATVLDNRGIAVRAGHHCTMPLHDLLGIPASTRASLAFYNTRGEIDQLCDGLRHARKVLGRRRSGA
jgi:cysteine desulfurase/selenocysteine lyase